MSQTLSDKNRLDINFNQAQVESILPEHFLEQYPTLVTFMKKFYEFMEENAGTDKLDNMLHLKDIESTDPERLDYLYYERLNGLGADRFNLPRLTLKLAPEFIKSKGTEVSLSLIHI